MENKEEKGISLLDLFNILLRNWLIIGITTVLVTVVAGIYAFRIATPMYESKSDVIVQVEASTELGFDYTTALRLVPSIAEFMKKDIVLNDVINELDLDMTSKEIREGLSVTSSSTTFFVYISYESVDPNLAKDIVAQIIESARKIANTDETFSSFENKISKATSDPQPGVYASPNKTLYVIIGFLLGGIIGVGIVLIKELTNNTYRSKSELEDDFDIQVLGVIPSFEVKEEL